MPSWQLQNCLGAFRVNAFNFHDRWRVCQETKRGGRKLLWIITNRSWRTIRKWILKDIFCFSVSIFVLRFLGHLLYIFHTASRAFPWNATVCAAAEKKKRIGYKRKHFFVAENVFPYTVGTTRRKEHALCRHCVDSSGQKSFHDNPSQRW